jgi:hypothetical protein
LLGGPLPAFRATRLEAHDIAVANSLYQFSYVEIMPAATPPTVCRQTVSGFGEIGECFQG